MFDNFRNLDITEKFFAILFYTLLIITLASIFNYAFSVKKHNGYYLKSGNNPYAIYINWDNAPDEMAFKTYDKKEIIEVFLKLNKKE